MNKVGIIGIVVIALVFLCMPVSAEFNTSSNQSGLNWEVYATTPVNLANTVGCSWVNFTWDEGIGGIPASSWNVSINGTWHNDTNSPFYNQQDIIEGTLISITVWGWNSTDNVLSEESISGQKTAKCPPPFIDSMENLIDATETSYTLLGILAIVALVSFIFVVLFAIQTGDEVNFTAILTGFVMLLGFFILLYIMLPLFDSLISTMGV